MIAYKFKFYLLFAVVFAWMRNNICDYIIHLSLFFHCHLPRNNLRRCLVHLHLFLCCHVCVPRNDLWGCIIHSLLRKKNWKKKDKAPNPLFHSTPSPSQFSLLPLSFSPPLPDAASFLTVRQKKKKKEKNLQHRSFTCSPECSPAPSSYITIAISP